MLRAVSNDAIFFQILECKKVKVAINIITSGKLSECSDIDSSKFSAGEHVWKIWTVGEERLRDR